LSIAAYSFYAKAVACAQKRLVDYCVLHKPLFAHFFLFIGNQSSTLAKTLYKRRIDFVEKGSHTSSTLNNLSCKSDKIPIKAIETSQVGVGNSIKNSVYLHKAIFVPAPLQPFPRRMRGRRRCCLLP
jgi:hypothetical protein